MASNPVKAAAHQIRDSLSDAMGRLGVGANHRNNQNTTTTNDNHNNNNTRQLSLDTSNIAKVLVIGETGSGKSTFINYLTNYFRGGSLQNIKVAIPSKYRPTITEQFLHCENNISDTSQSKTDMCNQYIFVDTTSPSQRQYLFLDTPGLSDTRGAEQDNINMNKIIEGVEGLGGLTAVIIVVNGTTGRLTLNLRNVIARLRGNLPDVVMDNVIVVMTNAKRHEANFNISSLQLHGTVYPYYMQNSAFSQDSNTWDQAAFDALQFDWDASMDELKRMIETIDTFKTKSVTAFKDMKDIRNAIKALMHEARLEVSQIQKMQDELAAFEHALKQYRTDEVTYKDYTRERVVETKELVDAKYHSTVCRKCDHVCHDKCGLHETTTHGNRIFQRCWAMSPEGQCYICPNNCLYTEHYHARKTMVVKQQKLQDVLHDIKAKYDLATRNKTDFQTRITTTQDAKKMLERALAHKLDEIKQKCAELRRICSGFNLAQELHALIDQLRAEATMLRNIEAKQQAEEFIRSLNEFCRQLEADQVSKQVLPPMRLVDTYTSKPFRPSTASTTSTFNPPTPTIPSESKPNLDTNVLDLIARLNRPKKQIQHVSSDDESANDDNADDDSGNENDEENGSLRSNRNSNHDNTQDDDFTSASDRRRRRQPTTTGTTGSNNNTNSPLQQYASVSTTDLVKRYGDCKDPRKANGILVELNRRSQGKSIGPLISVTDIGTFARYTQLYGSQDAPTLSHLYLQLQQRISNITEPDILNIVRVPNDLLLEIAAIYTLISQKTQLQTPSSDGSFPNESGFERPPDHVAPPITTKMPVPASQTPMGYYQSSMNQHPNGTITSTSGMFKPIPETTVNTINTQSNPSQPSLFSLPTTSSSNSTSASQHQQASLFSPQAPTPPNPTSSQLQQIPPVFSFPKPFSTASTISTQQQQQQQHQSSFPFTNLLGFSTTTASINNASSQIQSSSTSNTTNPFDRSTAGSPFTFINSSSSNPIDSSFAVVPSPATKDDYTMVNFAPASNVAVDDDFNNPNSLANMNTQRLVASYNDAKLLNRNAQLFSIYQELERRCTGINCNQFINDYPAVYDTKLKEHSMKTVPELQQVYSNIQQQIRIRTSNDATNISDVPTEFILESAALLSIIKQKGN